MLIRCLKVNEIMWMWQKWMLYCRNGGRKRVSHQRRHCMCIIYWNSCHSCSIAASSSSLSSSTSSRINYNGNNTGKLKEIVSTLLKSVLVFIWTIALWKCIKQSKNMLSHPISLWTTLSMSEWGIRLSNFARMIYTSRETEIRQERLWVNTRQK